MQRGVTSSGWSCVRRKPIRSRTAEACTVRDGRILAQILTDRHILDVTHLPCTCSPVCESIGRLNLSYSRNS